MSSSVLSQSRSRLLMEQERERYRCCTPDLFRAVPVLVGHWAQHPRSGSFCLAATCATSCRSGPVLLATRHGRGRRRGLTANPGRKLTRPGRGAFIVDVAEHRPRQEFPKVRLDTSPDLPIPRIA